MADKCKREKKALDRAKVAATRAHGRYLLWDVTARESSAAAESLLGSIGECFDSEGYLYPTCPIDIWIQAHRFLEAAQFARRNADGYFNDWLDAMELENDREEKYCDCRNRKGPR